MFRFFQDLIALRKAHDGLRSRRIDVAYIHNDNRVLAFTRWAEREAFLVVASFNNAPFGNGIGFGGATNRR
jgi:1,4-alpha-glucan branching enzyme